MKRDHYDALNGVYREVIDLQGVHAEIQGGYLKLVTAGTFFAVAVSAGWALVHYAGMGMGKATLLAVLVGVLAARTLDRLLDGDMKPTGLADIARAAARQATRRDKTDPATRPTRTRLAKVRVSEELP